MRLVANILIEKLMRLVEGNDQRQRFECSLPSAVQKVATYGIHHKFAGVVFEWNILH